jgi:hypothetical protein
MSKIKEALVNTNVRVELQPDTIDADYVYEEWLRQEEEKKQYYALLLGHS